MTSRRRSVSSAAKRAAGLAGDLAHVATPTRLPTPTETTRVPSRPSWLATAAGGPSRSCPSLRRTIVSLAVVRILSARSIDGDVRRAAAFAPPIRPALTAGSDRALHSETRYAFWLNARYHAFVADWSSTSSATLSVPRGRSQRCRTRRRG